MTLDELAPVPVPTPDQIRWNSHPACESRANGWGGECDEMQDETIEIVGGAVLKVNSKFE
jgi:hypothetical protein